ncbi:MAG: DUF4465 domain-containing protein [Sedimentisphaerales bacterium]
MMASVRMMKAGWWVCVIGVLVVAEVAQAEIATFDELALAPESYWNGADGTGGFVSGGMHFGNNYDADWGSWDGFSYSNITDTTTMGYVAQYNAVTGTGQGGSANYAVVYVGWVAPPTVTLETPGVVDGLYVTNSSYGYYSMLLGDAFAKKFGGASGDDPDWFLLTITGKDAGGAVAGSVDFYLADYRSADNGEDYIVDTWRYVDLTSLGSVKSLQFALSSSDADEPDGPYTEAGVNGYVDPNDGWRPARPGEADAILNPIFRGWAAEVVSYLPAPGLAAQWTDPNLALGPATGSIADIVSLGDLGQQQLDEGIVPGRIILSFDEPIRQGRGYDFVVFENGFASSANWDDGSVAGQMFAELAYVEVSSNGEDFVRFPAVSLTAGRVDFLLGTIDTTQVYNLAGKHPNAYGTCTGTPFDLSDVADQPAVVSGIVDINDVRYVRIVDIPGSGDFYDQAVVYINPNTWPEWDLYANNHPIYDAWNTTLAPIDPSGGFDLEAIGVLEEQEYSGDINLDGIVDDADLELLESALGSHFGQANWLARCDLAEPKDYVIDQADKEVLLSQWHQVEKWRSK